MGIDSDAGRLFGGGLLKSFLRNDDRVVDLSTLKTGSQQPSGTKPDRVDYLNFDQVTPTYGILKTVGLQMMNDHLLVAVTAASKSLAKIPGAERSWGAIVQAFSQCPLLAEVPKHHVDRVDNLVIERTNWFKQATEYGSIAADVRMWLRKFIQDQDIFQARGEQDLGDLIDIVAHAGRLLDGVVHRESRRRTLLDIGVLRYPDLENPYIKVYRLQLVAWYESTVVLGRASDRNGIEGQFNSRQFRPREATIERLGADVIERAAEDGRQLLMG